MEWKLGAWRNQPITEKQKESIYRMSTILGIVNVFPATKGLASDKIQVLIKEVENKLKNNIHKKKSYRGCLRAPWPVTDDINEWDPEENDMFVLDDLECF